MIGLILAINSTPTSHAWWRVRKAEEPDAFGSVPLFCHGSLN